MSKRSCFFLRWLWKTIFPLRNFLTYLLRAYFISILCNELVAWCHAKLKKAYIKKFSPIPFTLIKDETSLRICSDWFPLHFFCDAPPDFFLSLSNAHQLIVLPIYCSIWVRRKSMHFFLEIKWSCLGKVIVILSYSWNMLCRPFFRNKFFYFICC